MALADVNLTVREGEFVSIMGPSGCGKSTLLNLIGLLDEPTKGHGADQRLGHRQLLATARLPRCATSEIGFVFQVFHLVSDLSVLDNVQIPLLYRRMSNARAAEAGRGRARPRRPERTHRTTFRRSSPAASSSASPSPGRSSAGRASCSPTSRPATSTRRWATRSWRILRTLNREDKTTIVMVTHDQQKAAQTERIVRLFDGRQVN